MRQVHAAGDGHVEVAVDQRVARGGDRQQRRGAGAVDGVAAAAEVEVVADPAGDGVGQAAGERVLVDGRERRLVELLEARRGRSPSRSSSQPCSRSAAATVRRTYGQRSRIMLARANSPVRVLPTTTPVRSRAAPPPREAGVGQRRRRDVQGEPVRQVGRPVGAAGDLVARPGRTRSPRSRRRCGRRSGPGRSGPGRSSPLKGIRSSGSRRKARRPARTFSHSSCGEWRPGSGRPCRRQRFWSWFSTFLGPRRRRRCSRHTS